MTGLLTGTLACCDDGDAQNRRNEPGNKEIKSRWEIGGIGGLPSPYQRLGPVGERCWDHYENER